MSLSTSLPILDASFSREASPDTASQNKILNALSSESYTRLLPKLENVPLVFKQVIYEPGELIQYIYFPYNLLQRYTQTLIGQISQTVACNSHHSVEQRCCRWLLMCGDRAKSNNFPITQEFLSHMLGVRRASVTVVAGMLQKAEPISYSRGHMTITDRPGLEKVSCECYETIKSEFDCVFGVTVATTPEKSRRVDRSKSSQELSDLEKQSET